MNSTRDNLLKAFLDNGDVLGVELLGVSLVDQAHQQQGLSVILRWVEDDRWWSFIWIFWDQPFHLSAPDYHRWFPPLDGAPPSLEKINKTRQQFNNKKNFWDFVVKSGKLYVEICENMKGGQLGWKKWEFHKLAKLGLGFFQPRIQERLIQLFWIKLRFIISQFVKTDGKV